MVSKKDVIIGCLLIWFIPTFTFVVMSMFGYNISYFHGKSMFDKNGQECYYLERIIEPEDIQIGDIALFTKGLRGTLHRVIAPCTLARTIQGWETKGDNNEYSDGCTPYDYFTHKFIMKLWCD